MKAFSVFLLAICCLCGLCILHITYSAEAASKQFDVQFVVVPTANGLTEQAESYGTRELRSLHDVKLVGADPNVAAYFISICPVSITLSNGVTGGIAVSYVIEKGSMMEHNVLIGSPDQLKSLVEQIIATFDTRWLERERRK
jgi:hypothetical protein